MLRNLLQLVSFFDSASRMAQVSGGKDIAANHVAWHKRIVKIAAFFGLLGGLAGLAVLVMGGVSIAEEGLRVLMAPGLFAIGGVILGVALGCAFAPKEFFQSSLGRRWLNLIGTKNLALARATCLGFAAIPIGLVALLVVVSMSS